MKIMTGDEFFEYFQSWYEKNFKSLFNFVAFNVYNVEDTEDICAEICEKVLRKYHQFDSTKGTLTNWIFGIARNSIKNYFRVQNREINTNSHAISNEELIFIDNSSNPETNLQEKELFISMVKAIRFLSPQEQEILTLRYGAGFSYKEIARQLDITVSRVGVSLMRSHKKLRSIIELEKVRNETPE